MGVGGAGGPRCRAAPSGSSSRRTGVRGAADRLATVERRCCLRPRSRQPGVVVHVVADERRAHPERRGEPAGCVAGRGGSVGAWNCPLTPSAGPPGGAVVGGPGGAACCRRPRSHPPCVHDREQRRHPSGAGPPRPWHQPGRAGATALDRPGDAVPMGERRTDASSSGRAADRAGARHAAAEGGLPVRGLPSAPPAVRRPVARPGAAPGRSSCRRADRRPRAGSERCSLARLGTGCSSGSGGGRRRAERSRRPGPVAESPGAAPTASCRTDTSCLRAGGEASAAGITQRQLGRHLGASQTTISAWEAGARPGRSWHAPLARALRWDVESLCAALGVTEPTRPDVARRGPGDLPAVLRELRESSGLSRAQMGRCVGVDPRTVGKWESGSGRPSARSLRRLAALFGVPSHHLARLRGGSVDVWHAESAHRTAVRARPDSVGARITALAARAG